MKRTDTSRWPCNIARGANVLGDHWNLLLIRDACLGLRRFDDFQRSLGIGTNMLTVRLNRLVDEGILQRVPYQTNPARHEYRLSDKGRDAYSVLAALDAWARRSLAGPEGTPVLLHHDRCDRDMHALVVCSHCQAPIDVRDITARPATSQLAPGPSRAKPSQPSPAGPTRSRPPSPSPMVYHMAMGRKEVLVQLDDDLITRLDRLADQQGTSRSELLRRGAAAVLEAAEHAQADRGLQDAYRRMPQDPAIVAAASRLAALAAPEW